jgi:predicted nucleotidyltransferase
MAVKEKDAKKVKLSYDIDIITNEILKNFDDDDVRSIILYGSYGRGEGAFFYRDGDIHTYNDYDILIVAKDKLDAFKLANTKLALESTLSIKWIDLSQKTISKLKKLKPSIFNFDLKYGSKVIWGDQSVFEYIPKFKPEDIGLKEAKILFFTRIYTFLGSLKKTAFRDGVIGEDARFFRNQMAKAVLAVVDILLLQKKAYHQSYNLRVNRVKNLYPENIDLIQLADWALKEKLMPMDTSMSNKEVEALYSKVLILFLNEMKAVLSKFYGKKINTVDDFKKAKYYSLSDLVDRIKVTVASKSLARHGQIFNVQIAQAYIAEAYTQGEKERLLTLQKVLQIINKNFNNELTDRDWNTLRLTVAKLRMEI